MRATKAILVKDLCRGAGRTEGMLDQRRAGILRMAAEVYHRNRVSEAIDAASRITAHAEVHESEKPVPASHAHLRPVMRTRP